MDELKIILKSQLLTMVLRKIIKPQYCDFKDIYKIFKITIINGGFIHLKKKIYVDACMDAKKLI